LLLTVPILGCRFENDDEKEDEFAGRTWTPQELMLLGIVAICVVMISFGVWRIGFALMTGGMGAGRGIILKALKDEGIKVAVDIIISKFQEKNRREKRP
jgi:hypothetical protein